jgi:hypothetical protein
MNLPAFRAGRFIQKPGSIPRLPGLADQVLLGRKPARVIEQVHDKELAVFSPASLKTPIGFLEMPKYYCLNFPRFFTAG